MIMDQENTSLDTVKETMDQNTSADTITEEILNQESTSADTVTEKTLDQENTSANTVTEETMDQENTSANTVIEETKDQENTSADTVKETIDQENTSADTVKETIDQENTSADTVKETIDRKNTSAETVKETMDQENTSADTVISWQMPATHYLDIKVYNTGAASARRGLSLFAKIGIGIGVAGAVGLGAAIAAPFVVAGVGFTAGGVAAGSLAATWQALIGNVAAGSLFASLQSAGAAGLGAAGFTAASAFGAATGGALGGIIAGGVKKNIPIKTLEETFKKYVKCQHEIVSYEDLQNIVTDLGLTFTEEELKSKYTLVTGRNTGVITYSEFLRMFGVTFLKGQELENKLKDIFKEKVSATNRNMSLNNLPKMLESFGVMISLNDIKNSYAFVTDNDSKNVDTNTDIVSTEVFLEMCGCRLNQNFDLEAQVQFYDQNKNKDGKIDIKVLFTVPSSTSDPIILQTFLINFEEYLIFFDIKLQCEPLKAILIFRLSLLYFEFVKLASTDDYRISLSEAEDVLQVRGIAETNTASQEGERITFFAFLRLCGLYVDYYEILNITDADVNPQQYIHTQQLIDYVRRLNINITEAEVLKAIKTTADDDTFRVLNYFDFLKVLLVLDVAINDIL